MACPRCGGTQRIAVAPGYWECTKLVEEFGRPPGYTRPIPVRSHPCGHRYHEGSGVAESCACGTFAIGHCQRCGKAVCGDHSGLLAGVRLCTHCFRAQAEKEQRATEAAKAAQEAERQRERASLIEELEAAAGEAPRFLLENGPRTRPIGTIERKQKSHLSPGGGYTVSWTVFDKELGEGWWVAKVTSWD